MRVYSGRAGDGAGPHEPERPWRSDVVELAGVRVGVASLCSAWLSGPKKDARGSLVVGERQLRQLIDELEQAQVQLAVALVHHPLSWLDEEEEGTIGALLDQHFDLVLHGHLHRRDAKLVSRGSSVAAWMGAGAAYQRHGGDRWQGFFVGQIDGEQLSVDAFTHTSHDGGHWHPDASFDREGGTARRTETFRISGLGEAAASSASRLDALRARICERAERVYEAHAFIGLPDSAPKPAAHLTDIYVPTKLVAPPGARTGPPLRQVVGAAIVRDQAKAAAGFMAGLFTGAIPRSVVLGGPGSGKSTLCRYLALDTARRGALVPVLVSGRDWAEVGARETLLELAVRQLEQGLSVPMDEATLVAMCTAGDVLLLADGIDEVGGVERTRLRDMLLGFALEYPGARIVVTSRGLGYDDAPLDHAEFCLLHVAPFDDGQLRDFVERWSAVVEPHDAARRARGRAELLAALEAEPRAKELARTPLLATLIALVHRHRAALPGRRARLYELCVDLLVVTWPGSAGRALPDVPGEWQVARLEELALWMQHQRDPSHPAAGVMVARAQVEAMLRELLERSSLAQAGEGRGLARRWLRWLVESGLLQEPRHDAINFVHLSLMEYLAGQGALREQLVGGHQQVADFVVQHHTTVHWVEPLLLMLGSDAAGGELCNAVVDALLASPLHSNRMSFMLALLREEIEVNEAQRGQMLEAVAQASSLALGREWVTYRQLTHDILRFSQLHGQATRAWIDERLGTRCGRELLATFALTPGNYEPPPSLDARDPEQMQLVPLLELGETDSWGLWALAGAEAPTWLEWAKTSAPRGILAYALMSTQEALEGLGAVWVIGLLRRICWIGAQLVGATTERPAALRWRSAGAKVEIAAAPACRCVRRDGRVSPERADPSDRPYLLAALWDLSLHLSSKCKTDERVIGNERARRFDRFIQVRWVEANVGKHLKLDDDELLDLERLRSGLVGHREWIYGEKVVEQQLRSRFSPEVEPIASLPRPLPDHTPTLPWTREGEPIPDTWPAALAFFASFHAGLVAAGSSLDRTAVGEMYVHDLWLNLNFDAVIDWVQGCDMLTDHQHALLLALGLAQFQTTWRWPMSKRWQSWFADAPAPEHWLAAHVWHLCWAVAEPDDPAHRERAAACLDRGDWPGLVATLREYDVAAPS